MLACADFAAPSRASNKHHDNVKEWGTPEMRLLVARVMIRGDIKYSLDVEVAITALAMLTCFTTELIFSCWPASRRSRTRASTSSAACFRFSYSFWPRERMVEAGSISAV